MLYATTMNGGFSNLGAVFSFDVGLGPFLTFVLNRGTVGDGPDSRKWPDRRHGCYF